MKTVLLPLAGKVLLQPTGLKPSPPLGSAPGFGKLVGPRGEPERPGTSPPSSTPPGHEREMTPRRHDATMSSTDDPLDRGSRQAALLAPPPQSVVHAGATEAADAPAATRASTSLEDLLPALVRKVAWSGDGRKGTVRLELGSGGMAGAEVIVESDEGRVRVQLRAPDGVDGDAWRRRVSARLAARGLDVEDVEVE
jgi:hypothetical protein